MSFTHTYLFNCAYVRISVAVKPERGSPSYRLREHYEGIRNLELRVEVDQWKFPEGDGSYPKER